MEITKGSRSEMIDGLEYQARFIRHALHRLNDEVDQSAGVWHRSSIEEIAKMRELLDQVEEAFHLKRD